MIDTGELLALLQLDRRFGSITAEVHSFVDGRVTAQLQQDPSARRISQAPASAAQEAGPFVPRLGRVYEKVWQIWHRSQQWRVEASLLGKDEPSVHIIDGPLWWRYDPAAGLMTNEAGSRPFGSAVDPMLSILLDPAPLIPSLLFSVKGEVEYAGKRAVHVTARPRPVNVQMVGLLPPLWPNADEYEFVIEALRGILLCYRATLQGREWVSNRMVKVDFDVELSDALFQPDARW